MTNKVMIMKCDNGRGWDMVVLYKKSKFEKVSLPAACVIFQNTTLKRCGACMGNVRGQRSMCDNETKKKMWHSV